MVIDYSHVIPPISPTEQQKEAIHKLTREGGTAIAKDILKKTSEHDPKTNEVTKEGIKQSAFLGTAAATAIMVEAFCSKEPVKLPVSHYGEVSGATLGRMCDVSENGAVITYWKGDIQKGREAYLDARGASRYLADAKAKAASQKSSPTPS
jgi:malate/lactate dehydrogenase